jgi:hypothetical protein
MIKISLITLNFLIQWITYGQFTYSKYKILRLLRANNLNRLPVPVPVNVNRLERQPSIVSYDVLDDSLSMISDPNLDIDDILGDRNVNGVEPLNPRIRRNSIPVSDEDDDENMRNFLR